LFHKKTGRALIRPTRRQPVHRNLLISRPRLLFLAGERGRVSGLCKARSLAGETDRDRAGPTPGAESNTYRGPVQGRLGTCEWSRNGARAPVGNQKPPWVRIARPGPVVHGVGMVLSGPRVVVGLRPLYKEALEGTKDIELGRQGPWHHASTQKNRDLLAVLPVPRTLISGGHAAAQRLIGVSRGISGLSKIGLVVERNGPSGCNASADLSPSV